MLRRSGRASLAALLMLSLLLPAVGFAANDDELERIRTERQELLDSIDAHRASADSLQDEADALNDNMIRLRNELARLDSKIAAVESRVRDAQSRIDDTQSHMDKIKALATRQAVLLYKTSGTQALDTILGSADLAELDARIEFLGVAASQNSDALVTYGRLRESIEAQHRVLFARKAELTEVRLSQTEVLEEMDKHHELLAADLSKLEAKIDEEERHEGSLASAQARLEGDISTAMARDASASRGTSAQGFIWPLNGAITSYYGPRWGRMHEGIDIDGVTGEPVIASNSGTVILASYYSGYGNAVVIDHGGGFSTLYGHHSELLVSVGQQVLRGDVVGRVGCTGSCTGDHLHFEIRVNGSPQDPLNYLP